MCMNIKYFNLATHMERAEYMWVPATMLPDESMVKYQLRNLTVNGCVLTNTTHGMYGLPTSSRIEYGKLVNNL